VTQVTRTLRRLPAVLLILLVRAYQLLVSPLLGQTCRFYPSCSAYAVQALREHGAVRGTWLTVRRLARCHPWNPGGVDHVPPAGGRVPPSSPHTPDGPPADPAQAA
jgi:putative membrane protein insertion efficiency factor